jgi:hypothetical protein
MINSNTTSKVLVVASLILAFVSVSHGQARTWVSGVGSDSNPCSITAPCQTLSQAVSVTPINGEVNCLDPGSYGSVTITKSITIDCHEVFSGHSSSTNTIVINFDLFAASDTRNSVRLRNLTISGRGSGTRGIQIFSSAPVPESIVHIEDCLIDGTFGSPGRGIEDKRLGGGRLLITNTTIRNVAGAAISHSPLSGSARIDITVDNVRIYNSLFGIAITSGARLVVTNSVISGSTSAGLFADGPLAASDLHASNLVLNNNATAIQQGAGGTIRIANSQITNSTANGTVGAVFSYGNNRTLGNAGVTVLTPVGGDSHDKGQQ